MREAGDDFLLLELGDAGTGTGDFAALKARVYEAAFPLMSYDAVGLGEWEVKYVKEMNLKQPYGDRIPTINANVVHKSTGKLLSPRPYVVKQTKAGLKVGLISVLSENLIDANTREKLDLAILPPEEAVAKYAEELGKKSDLVILLCHTTADEARKLAEKISGVDIVLSGHISAETSLEPAKIGEAVFMQSRSAGKYVCKLVLDIDADKKVAGFTGDYPEMNRDFKDDPKAKEIVAQHDLELQEYYDQVRGKPVPVTGPTTPRPVQTFVAVQRCRQCHTKEYDSWAKTDHARALDSLKKDGKDKEPECLSCHTTGYKFKGGFTSGAETPQLANVQCEACHGVGIMHARRPDKNYGALMESTCVRCHDKGNSPKFSYKEYRARILHNTPDSAK